MTERITTPMYPIDRLFPRSDYKQAGQSMVLHYWIALDQPSEKTKSWIEKHPECLNYREEKHLKLTPLAVCVLKQNKEMAQLLLERGADPTIGDHQGWTPFHHAAILGDDAMLQLLMQKVEDSAAKKLLNSQRGNYQDLKNLVKAQIVTSEEKVCYHHEEGKEATVCTAKQFQTLTHARYCNSVIASPAELVKKWVDPQIEKVQDPKVKQFLEEEYQRCISNPPKISIGKDFSSLPHGFDVFAEEDLKAFQGITVYGGQLQHDSSNTEYLFDDINGEKIRNLGPMINDGFPNSMFVKVFSHGFGYYLSVAIRDIKKGEKIVWNYGAGHTIKLYSPHFELNSIELENYVTKNELINTVENLCRFSSSGSDDLRELLSHFAKRERARYVLETPSLLLYLLSKNLFQSVEDIAQILHQNPGIFQLVGLQVEQLENRKEFARMCVGIGNFLKQHLTSGHQELVTEVQKLLLEWSESIQIALVMNFSLYFINSLENDIKSIEDWNDFKKDLKPYVEFMESLHYYCSDVNEIKHSEYLSKIKESFESLSTKKKDQAFKDINAYAENLDLSRKKVLLEASSQFA